MIRPQVLRDYVRQLYALSGREDALVKNGLSLFLERSEEVLSGIGNRAARLKMALGLVHEAVDVFGVKAPNERDFRKALLLALDFLGVEGSKKKLRSTTDGKREEVISRRRKRGPGRPSVSSEKEKEIVLDLRRDRNFARVARKRGVSDMTVARIAMRKGIIAAQSNKKISEEKRAAALEAAERLKNFRAAAREVGLSHTSVARIVKQEKTRQQEINRLDLN